MDPIWYCKTCGTLGDKKEVCCGAMMVSPVAAFSTL